MTELLKAAGDVSLDEPDGPGPGVIDFPQCSRTTAFGAKSVRVVTQLWLVIRLENEAHHFLHQFVRPHRHAERPLLPIFLRDKRPPCWEPLIALVAQGCDDRIHLSQ